MAFEFIAGDLEARDHQHLLRKPVVVKESHDGMIEVDGKPYINFSSNDYLGLKQDPTVLQAWLEGLAIYGGGSGASPLVTGHTVAHQRLCEDLAQHVNRDAVMLFSSGFAANQAICQALFKQPGQLVADKLSHASLIEGGLSTPAQFKRFAHNDLAHLQSLLTPAKAEDTANGNRLIATEGVFSMDGDTAPVKEIAKLAASNNAWLMVDDAHGFGVFGDQGQGVAASQTDQAQCQVLMATLGKACGTGGAFVAGSRDLIDYLTNFAKHYIYSTAMPPAQAHASSAAVEMIKIGESREKLHENIQYFREAMTDKGFKLLVSDSAIQPIILGDPKVTLDYSQQLKLLGMWVSAIRSPTVPKGTDRLRITLSSLHQREDIDALLDALQIARERV